jgi:hypothetical protein
MAAVHRAIDNSEQLVAALAELKSVSRTRHMLRRDSREHEAARIEEQRLIMLVRALVGGTPIADTAR